ncbi:MAG: 1-acyl-sn-glycerol-3-phosphate acyltransferase, partial [Candidatus Eisenbacteria bacterium]|nr:1-acyl-sn-glycerol-3-phosphate acyltransferase [Candidatus Eisenbacteria bacterium]
MRFHYRIGWTLARLLVKLLWGFRAEGYRGIPRHGPVLLASNHISGWDPLLVGLGCPRETHFLAKEELFRNPFLGWLIRTYNAIPVRRGASDRRALRRAVSVLERGGAMLMFPEGTRSRDGRLGKGRAGAAWVAATAGAVIVPVWITGSRDLAGAFRRKRLLLVRYGRPIAPREDGDYRALAEEVMAAI